MSHVRIKLSEIMGRHRIKQLTLAKQAGLKSAVISDWYHGRRTLLDTGQMVAILEALEALTGERFSVADLVEWVRDG